MDLFQERWFFYLLIGLSAFLAIVVTFLCLGWWCRRRKRNKDAPKNLNLKSNVAFQYQTGVEEQQLPIKCHLPPKSLPTTPLERRHSLAVNPSKERRHSLDPRTLDLEMYKRERKELMGSLPYLGLGRLCFSLWYDRTAEKLFVSIICMAHLQMKPGNATPQLFIKVLLLPDKKKRLQTKTIKDCSPAFNEEFVFAVPNDEILSRTLKLSVCSYDRFSRQSTCGYVIFPVVEAKEGLVQNEGTGEIWKEITKDGVPPGEINGELLLSLSHLPTAGRLTIVILKGKDLRVNDDADSGVYVKISMVSSGKQIKSKKTTHHKKRDIVNPVFNESFVFEIPPEYIDRISFVMTVCTNSRSGSGKRLVGRVVIGPYMYSSGDGLAHWNEMLLSPRHAIAHWHKLC